MQTTPRRARWIAAALLSIAIGGLAQPVLAQPDGGEPAGAADRALTEDAQAPAEARSGPDLVSFELSLSPSHSFSADFDDVGGDVSVTRLGARFGARFVLPPKSSVSLSFGTQHAWYDFGGSPTLVPGVSDPFDHITHYDVDLSYATSIDDEWSLFVGGNVSSGMEDGADFGESLTFGGVVGVRYKVSDSLSIGLAVAAASRLEDEVRVIPLPTIDWQIDERWRLGSWNIGYQAAGYALTYKASDALTYGVAGGFHAREFRLDEDGPIPGGVGREQRIPVGFVMSWTPEPQFEISGFAGAEFATEFEVLSSGGSSLGEDQTDPSLMIGVTGRIRF